MRAAIVAIAVAACQQATTTDGAEGPEGALIARSDITIEIVTHGQAIDGFWGVVRNGVTYMPPFGTITGEFSVYSARVRTSPNSASASSAAPSTRRTSATCGWRRWPPMRWRSTACCSCRPHSRRTRWGSR